MILFQKDFSIPLHRSRKGLDTPYQFWIFYPLFGKSLSKKFKGQN